MRNAAGAPSCIIQLITKTSTEKAFCCNNDSIVHFLRILTGCIKNEWPCNKNEVGVHLHYETRVKSCKLFRDRIF